MDSSKIIKLIRKLVKEEVRRAIKPALNEALADRFIATLAESNSRPSNPKMNLGSALITEEAAAPVYRGRSPEEVAAEQVEARRKAIAKITAGNEDMAMYFEDTDPISAAGPVMEGAYIDADDGEGVDLSQFSF